MGFDTFVADLIAGLLAAAIFAFLFFLIREKCFGPKEVNGKWYFETKTESSAYKPYLGMTLGYVAIVWREADRIYGTTEKIYEKSINGDRDFVGEHRTRGVIDGTYIKRYFSKDQLAIHVVEDGFGRESTYFYELQVEDSVKMAGDFSSMVADQIGTTRWQRNPF